MPTQVQLPDGNVAEFPDGMSQAEIEQVLQRQFSPPQTLKEQMERENINPASLMREVAEPLLTMGSGFGSSVWGGIKGAVAAPFVGSGRAADMVRETQREGTYLPRSPEGQRGLEGYSGMMDAAANAVNVPLSYAGGALELISGQGAEQAGETMRNIRAQGATQTAGDRTLDETNSPALATLASIAPEAVGMMFPVARASASRHAAMDEMRRELVDGSTDAKVAGYKLTDGNGGRVGALDLATDGDGPPRLPPPAGATTSPEPQPPVPWQMKVEKDRLQQGAIKQGVDRSVVAMINQASPQDRKLMREMLDRMERIRDNKRASADTDKLPRTVIGDTLKQRVDYLLQTKKQAGKELDAAVDKSKTLQVDHSQPVQRFIADLEKMGIRLDEGNQPIFRGSDIEKHKPTMDFIEGLVERMRDTDVTTAYDVHRLKRYIDANVNYKNPAEGLKGSTEAIAKQLRGRLNKVLQDAVPGYKEANTKYADTKSVVDELQRLTGKTDLDSEAGAGALGTLMRRLTSNAASRSQVEAMVDQADVVARKYGGEFGDDVKNLQTFANELDRYFGSVADTSFQAEVGKGMQRAALDMATGQPGGALTALNENVLARTINKVRGVNSENAYKALAELLEAQ